MNETYRCFIAIEIPEKILDEVVKLSGKLAKSIADDSARWCNREQLHITLKFLGNVDALKIDALKSAIQRTCSGFNQFQLTLGGIGCFPDIQKPRVIWLGIGGDLKVLNELQAAIDIETADFGDHQEEREFKPHLTLARVKKPSPKLWRAIGEQIKRHSENARAMGEWNVDSVNLMRSILDPSGAVYEKLYTAPLKKAC